MIRGDNFLFILNPKAASHSIGMAFSALGFPLTRSHKVPDEKPEQPVVAAVWRDPEERLFSAYRHAHRHKSGPSFEDWRAGAGRAFKVFENVDIRDVPQEIWFEHVTHRLRFEGLSKDWSQFLSLVGLPDTPLPHLNEAF